MITNFFDTIKKERKKMKENERLIKQLYDKLNNEYHSFLEEIKLLSAEQIIEKAYEITCKEQYPDMFYGVSNYSNEELESLLKQENTLDYLYNDWIHADGGLHSVLEENMITGLDELIDRTRLENPNNELIIKIKEALKQFDNYDLCYHLKDYYRVDEFDYYTINNVIKSKDIRKLKDFFYDMKSNEQVQDLLEKSLIDSQTYESVSTDIIPKLDKIVKEQSFKSSKSKGIER